VPDYQFTPYFENQVMRKRPYLTKEMCIRVVRSAIRAELQENDRYRFWGKVDELGGRERARSQDRRLVVGYPTSCAGLIAI
jgi:hypothetical protein